MNGRKGLFVFGAGVVATLGLIASAGAGCQNSGSGTGGNASGNGGNTTQGTATNSGPGGNAGGNGSMSTSTISGSNTGGSTSAGMGGSAACSADSAHTITEIAKGADNGGLGKGIPVKVTGAVAMSHKFLVSQSKSTGSCLWGVFLSEPGIATTAPFSGVLAASYGTDAVTNEAGSAFCPVPPLDPAGDAFPDDVAPGDVLDVIGKTDAYAPTACGTMGNPAATPQVQLSQVCQATKMGTAAVPALATLSLSDATKLATGDGPTSEKWAGVKVQMGAQTATPVNACSCATPPPNCMASLTDCFGNITLAGSNLEITDKIYYQGLLSKSFMKTCHAGPDYTDPAQAFTNVQGFISLDFCTWEIYPNDKCTDLSPGGADCPCTDCTNSQCH